MCKIVKKIKAKHFKELNKFYKEDSSHGWSHVEEVAKDALRINKKLKLNLDKKKLVLVSLFHDIWNNIDRDKHHMHGAEHFKSYMQKIKKYSDLDILEMKLAIQEHRASNKGNYSSLFSEVIAAAYRGEPNLKKIILRSFKYYIETGEEIGIVEITKNVHAHIVEKYSRHGYIKYNSIYFRFYKNKINKLYEKIEKLTEENVFRIINKQLNKEILKDVNNEK